MDPQSPPVVDFLPVLLLALLIYAVFRLSDVIVETLRDHMRLKQELAERGQQLQL